MKHTPGEWIAHTQGADAWVECPDGRKFIIGDIIYHKENISNARLIAAAPEMLEACKSALAAKEYVSVYTEVLPQYDACYKKIFEAIAKAEGERDD